MNTVSVRIFWFRRLLFLFAMCGFFVATYLFITYTKGGPIVCGLTHGCDVVRASKWSSMFGIPTPLFGMLFYFGMMSIIVFRTIASSFQPKLLLQLTRVGAIAGIIESIYLTSVQMFQIHAFCSWCLSSAFFALCLFCVVWGDGVAAMDEKEKTRELKVFFFSFFIAFVIGAIAIVSLTLEDKTIASVENPDGPVLIEESKQENSDVLHLLYPEDLSWRGSSSSTVRVVEFVDFECPACRSAYAEIESALKSYEQEIRFSYRMFPLPSHEYSAGAALAAICADRQESLFPYADLLMEEEGLDRNELIRRAADLRLDMDAFIACLDDQSTQERARRDFNDGIALGVNSTPTIFVNEYLLQGLPNAKQLTEIIERVKRGE